MRYPILLCLLNCIYFYRNIKHKRWRWRRRQQPWWWYRWFTEDTICPVNCSEQRLAGEFTRFRSYVIRRPLDGHHITVGQCDRTEPNDYIHRTGKFVPHYVVTVFRGPAFPLGTQNNVRAYHPTEPTEFDTQSLHWSDGIGDFGLQSSPSTVQVAFSSRQSSPEITSSNMNAVPMMENLLGTNHLTTVDWTNFRHSEAFPRGHIISPTNNTINRLSWTRIVSTDFQDAYPAQVLPNPGGEQLHIIRTVRRDIRASTEQEQVFGPREPYRPRNEAGPVTSAV